MSEVRLINANKLIRQLEICKANANPLDYNTKATYAECIAMVKAAEIIDAEPVRYGHWIHKLRQYEMDECNCSECGQLMTTAIGQRMSYCPNCGTKMNEEK